MNKKEYLKDKWLIILIILVNYFIILLILFAFKINVQATLAIWAALPTQKQEHS